MCVCVCVRGQSRRMNASFLHHALLTLLAVFNCICSVGLHVGVEMRTTVQCFVFFTHSYFIQFLTVDLITSKRLQTQSCLTGENEANNLFPCLIITLYSPDQMYVCMALRLNKSFIFYGRLYAQKLLMLNEKLYSDVSDWCEREEAVFKLCIYSNAINEFLFIFTLCFCLCFWYVWYKWLLD